MRSANSITEFTRRNLFDSIRLVGSWAGCLEEDDFLARIYPLDQMQSQDPRFQDARSDIYQHRVRNEDWPEGWLLSDQRFNLRHCPDDDFLRFLVETVHPIVRPDIEDVEHLVATFNRMLEVDGWEVIRTGDISGHPVFGFRTATNNLQLHTQSTTELNQKLNSHYVAQQIFRINKGVEDDPELAIGAAKEFLETICKIILQERHVSIKGDDDFPKLVKEAVKSLRIVPEGMQGASMTEQTIKILINNLTSLGRLLAELRNDHGTGHGKLPDHIGLERRHAKLAVGAVTTVALFLFESHSIDRG